MGHAPAGLKALKRVDGCESVPSMDEDLTRAFPMGSRAVRVLFYRSAMAFRERLTITVSSEEPVASPTSIALASVNSVRSIRGSLCSKSS